MLKSLHIRDLALVEDIQLFFGDGLNVLTGSTGAGKSLILGAVNILLGERIGPRAIRSGGAKAVVEAEFIVGQPPGGATVLADILDQSGGRLAVRREILKQGRSAAYVNDRPVTLKRLQEITRQLIEPHGQNEQLRLRDPDSHVCYLDALAENTAERETYQAALKDFNAADQALKSFDRKIEVLRDKQELLAHRIDEVHRAKLKKGEKADLETRARVMERGEEIAQVLSAACESLYDNDAAAGGLVGQARRKLEQLATLDERLQRLAGSLETVEIGLAEATGEMRAYLETLEFDPEILEALRGRLGHLIELERRHGMTIDALIEAAQGWTKELETLALGDDERARLEEELARRRDALAAAAKALSRTRRQASRRLDRVLTESLSALMMHGAVFRTDIRFRKDEGADITIDGRPARAGANGIDQIVFCVRTNPGEAEGPVAEIASSGELSRIALALKELAGEGRAGSTLVFDELDAGVGADLGDTIAKKLHEIATRYQIICITHMPQIAIHARRHLVVRKKTEGARTVTRVEVAEGEARLEEIARMLGGTRGSQKRLALAREMLQTTRETHSPDVRP